MLKNRIVLTGLALILSAGALFAAACSAPAPAAPAPAGPSADEIRAIVQQEVQNAPAPVMAPPPAPAMAPAGPSAEEIAAMVQQIVADAIPDAPDAPSAADIQRIVMTAVDSAMDASAQPSLTTDDVEDIVQSAVMEASANQAAPLSASEVEAIVAAAIDAIPTPEPAMMMMPTGPTGDPVKVGVVMDYTGDLGPYGRDMQKGVDLAARLINEAGGVLGRPIEPVHRDGGSSAQISTDAANALVKAEGVQAIVGGIGSGFTLAIANAVTIPNGIVQISPSATSPALTVLEDNDYLYRAAVSDASQGVVLARLARELGYDSAAAIYVNNAYGEGLANVFEKNFTELGGTVTALVPQEANQPSYVSEIENAVADNPDVLVTMSYPISAGVYLREAIEGDYINAFLFTDATKNQDLFDGIGAENFEGMLGTAPGTPFTDDTRIFQIEYEKAYGFYSEQPFVGESFDAFAIIALAIEQAGAYESEAIRDSMRAIANPPGIKVGPGDFAKALDLIRRGEDIDYEGVAGSQNFDENGDVLNSIEIWQIKDGKVAGTGRYETP